MKIYEDCGGGLRISFDVKPITPLEVAKRLLEVGWLRIEDVAAVKAKQREEVRR